MKQIPFTKMSGAGNDFIVVEWFKGLNAKKLAVRACDRTNGIGADGLLVLDSSKSCDYRMHIINADGSTAEMCGNGVRCLAAYIVRHRKPKKKLFSIETLAGTILGKSKGTVATVRLSDPVHYKPSVPLKINGRSMSLSSIDTGVPHAVIFVDGLKAIDVTGIGNRIRFHKKFQPRGTNVNFAEQVRDGLVAARTYERGVEDETKACGTGSVAVAIVTYLKAHPAIKNKTKARMNVLTAGKEILSVTFDLADSRVSNVWLKGRVKFICEGGFNF